MRVAVLSVMCPQKVSLFYSPNHRPEVTALDDRPLKRNVPLVTIVVHRKAAAKVSIQRDIGLFWVLFL